VSFLFLTKPLFIIASLLEEETKQRNPKPSRRLGAVAIRRIFLLVAAGHGEHAPHEPRARVLT
jgi:hypothetical protein